MNEKERRGCPVGTRKSELVPVEIPDMGIRYIPKAYGGAGCELHDNCFTCPYPVDECRGGKKI